MCYDGDLLCLRTTTRPVVLQSPVGTRVLLEPPGLINERAGTHFGEEQSAMKN